MCQLKLLRVVNLVRLIGRESWGLPHSYFLHPNLSRTFVTVRRNLLCGKWRGVCSREEKMKSENRISCLVHIAKCVFPFVVGTGDYNCFY